MYVVCSATLHIPTLPQITSYERQECVERKIVSVQISSSTKLCHKSSKSEESCHNFSPVQKCFPKFHKNSLRKWLCEDVRKLVGVVYRIQLDGATTNVFAKVVVCLINMFCAWPVFVACCDLQGSSIVFVCLAVDARNSRYDGEVPLL